MRNVLPRTSKTTRFAAIDFETANNARNSACALAVVLVEDGRITRRFSSLIKPPFNYFCFTDIHGISWQDVATSPSFARAWAEVSPLVADTDFFVAHNASFDRSVLQASCLTSKLALPPQPFHCTVKWARTKWNIFPTRLPDVCRHLGIPLVHHNAASDAEACAHIALAALKHD